MATPTAQNQTKHRTAVLKSLKPEVLPKEAPAKQPLPCVGLQPSSRCPFVLFSCRKIIEVISCCYPSALTIFFSLSLPNFFFGNKQKAPRAPVPAGDRQETHFEAESDIGQVGKCPLVVSSICTFKNHGSVMGSNQEMRSNILKRSTQGIRRLSSFFSLPRNPLGK